MKRETIKDEKPSPKTSEQAAPGVVLVFSGGAACFHVIPLLRGALELGRDDLAALHLSDARVSRQHLGLRLDGSCWTFTDRGSTNGVFLDGKQLQGTQTGPSPRVVRIGKTLLLPVSDVTPYVLHGVSVTAERIVGPSLRQVLDQIAKVGRLGQNVLITGPSGAGKELAARLPRRRRVPGQGSSVRRAQLRDHPGRAGRADPFWSQARRLFGRRLRRERAGPGGRWRDAFSR